MDQYRIATTPPGALTADMKRACRVAPDCIHGDTAGPHRLSTTAVTATVAGTPSRRRPKRVISRILVRTAYLHQSLCQAAGGSSVPLVSFPARFSRSTNGPVHRDAMTPKPRTTSTTSKR